MMFSDIMKILIIIAIADNLSNLRILRSPLPLQLDGKVHGQICSKNRSCTGQDDNYHPERKNTHGQYESTCYSMILAMF
ncbi:hypothetical protein VEGS15_17610 [Escherichia coli]|nr:hypothetical protein VEGS15_17610 [Escherichia coli]